MSTLVSIDEIVSFPGSELEIVLRTIVMAQYTGTVKWFNNAKGYGFLGTDGKPDVFCHYSAIQGDGYKSLKEGEPVEYDVAQGGSGKPQAENVRRIGKE